MVDTRLRFPREMLKNPPPFPVPMKLISWNVNGIRAVLNKGFPAFVSKEAPDILCIQETKAHPQQVDVMLSEYPFHHWSSAEKAGYAGTAVFSRQKPLAVKEGMGIAEHDTEGRILTLEWKDYFLVNAYVPNSGRELPRLKYRERWDGDFLQHLKKLDAQKPVIICGDFNVAHTAIDLAHPKENYNKTAGYTQMEIDGFDNFIQAGFVDTFREFHQQPGQYTFWSYMFNARKKNIGWRIDYFLASRRLIGKVQDSFILPAIMGSDHCPIGMLFD